MEVLNEKINKFLQLESGYGYGYGDGYGSGYGIKSFNGKVIYLIDHVQTIITNVYKNVAKGFIVNNDLTLDPCYIAKGLNMFAHGTTSKDAIRALREKIFDNLEPEEAIEEFRKKFKKNKKYKGTDFFEWHHILTGSCEAGRNNFVKNHELDLNEQFSVNEFIKICEDDYGGSVIKQLKQYYEEE